MNKTPTDQPVRHRIEHDLDRTFLVEAGAGSGKTHCLARRIARGIANGHYQIEHVAAVTFTRKAAAELRGRLQLALETLRSANPSSEERDRMDQALRSIERFFAGTIHSFCGHLLRERPVEARIAPGFVEIDDVEDQHRRKQSWRDFVARERGSGSTLIPDLQDAGVKPSDLDPAFGIVCEHDEVEFPAGDGSLPDAATAWKSLDTFFSTIDKLMPAPFDFDSTCEVQWAVVELRDRIKVVRRNQPGNLAALLCLFEGTLKQVNNRWGDGSSRNNRVAAQVSALVNDFQTETVIPWVRSWRQYVYHLSITALTRARETYATERRRDNVVNYTDLLSAAARLLRTDAVVRRELQEKHRWILVDEFQDTDPIQAEVLLLMAAKEDSIADPSNVDWSRVQLRPGALFIVGDPKQSIYRFRRADIEVYNTVRRLIEASDGEVLSLTACWRSLPEVCSLANDVFPARFPQTATSEAPKFEPLEPVRPSPAEKDKSASTATGIATLTLTPSASSDMVSEEASRIARYIKGQVSAGPRTHGHFLIVTRQRSNLGIYAAALEELEIPVEVSGAGMFTSSPDVAALCLLLKSIADPLDSVALVGVLRGPLFGVSDQQLFAYRQSGGRFELTAPVVEASSDGAIATGALHSLQKLYRLTRTLPAGAALEVILDETGLLALAATSPGGAAAGNLLQAVDMVRQVTEMGGSLAEAAEAIEEDAPLSTEIESLPLEPGRQDVVRVMNLHRVKGLEAPVVFLADPTHGYVFPPDVRIVREGGRSRGYMIIQWKSEAGFGKRTIGEPVDWDTHEEIEKRYTDAERDRLVYVAATRARDLLVVSRVLKQGANKAWGAFDNYLSHARELEVLPVPQRIDRERPDCSAAVRTLAAAARAEKTGSLGKPSWTVSRATDEAHHRGPAKRIRGELADEPIVEATTSPDDLAILKDTQSHRADSGYAWGLLIHGLLELAMARKETTRKDLERLARWLTVDFPDLREFIPRAVDVVENVAQAGFWQEARTADECHVEAPFATQLPGPNGVPSVLHGIIDLVYRSGEGWKVLDYKTDQVSDASELVDRYRSQITQYVDAWQNVVKATGAEGALYSVRTNQKVIATPRE
jgi:ATP-dependent helicase/nuclease subunit A